MPINPQKNPGHGVNGVRGDKPKYSVALSLRLGICLAVVKFNSAARRYARSLWRAMLRPTFTILREAAP